MNVFARSVTIALVMAWSGTASPIKAQDPEDASSDAVQALAGPSDYAELVRSCRSRVSNGAGTPPSGSTPVTVRIIQPIIPVPVTDGFIHLAYAAEATNVSRTAATVLALTPVDPLASFKPTGTNSVLDADNKDITGKIRLFNPNLLSLIVGPQAETATDFTLMPGGSAGTTFFDVRYKRAADLPRLIALEISVQVAANPPITIVAPSDPLFVSCEPPPVLRPPLVGSNWWNGNGCCEIVGPHRGATLPINGDLHAPESFAIDYVQLNASNGCCTGPIHDLASWPFYGAPILAAGNGVIVEMQDGLPEQIPAQNPVGVTVANAAGNHIIESIEDGRYFILYAHLKTGSIARGFRVGTRLRAGQHIGDLGNSGSTTAPHLHFQVMDRPSALNAAGLPFVFTGQQLQGTVIGTLDATSNAYESGEPVVVDRSTTGWQALRMPGETQVFGYNLR